MVDRVYISFYRLAFFLFFLFPPFLYFDKRFKKTLSQQYVTSWALCLMLVNSHRFIFIINQSFFGFLRNFSLRFILLEMNSKRRHKIEDARKRNCCLWIGAFRIRFQPKDVQQFFPFQIGFHLAMHISHICIMYISQAMFYIKISRKRKGHIEFSMPFYSLSVHFHRHYTIE